MNKKSICMFFFFFTPLTACTNSTPSNLDSKVSVDSFPILEKEYINIPSIREPAKENSESNSEPIREGECQWFTYTASDTAPHAFITRCINPVIMELFHDHVMDNSEEGRITFVEASSKTDYEFDETNDRYVCFYDLFLRKGDIIWIRTRGIGNSPDSAYAGYTTVFVSYENDDGAACTMADDFITIRHQHTYGYFFGTYDDKRHKSYCWKDEEYLLEDHHFDAEGVCEDCGYRKE